MPSTRKLSIILLLSLGILLEQFREHRSLLPFVVAIERIGLDKEAREGDRDTVAEAHGGPGPYGSKKSFEDYQDLSEEELLKMQLDEPPDPTSDGGPAPPGGMPNFKDFVWMAAYKGKLTSEVETLVEHKDYESVEPFEAVVKRAKAESLRSLDNSIDIRLGGFKRNEPMFPVQCRLDSLTDFKPCVYLFQSAGAEGGQFLPLWPTKERQDLENAQCLNLERKQTWKQFGRDMDNFGTNGTFALTSLRLQAKVGIELYETNNCSSWRDSLALDVKQLNGSDFSIDFVESRLPLYRWRYTNNFVEKDTQVFNLATPAYTNLEPACPCPTLTDHGAIYPPTDDEIVIRHWDSLAANGLLSSALTDWEKGAVVRFLANPYIPAEPKHAVLTRFMSDEYHLPKSCLDEDLQIGEGFDDCAEEVKTEMMNQVWGPLVDEGPKNLEMPFPPPCTPRFSPISRRFRSAKVVVNFKVSDFSQMTCGETEEAKQARLDRQKERAQEAARAAELKREKAARDKAKEEADALKKMQAKEDECADSPVCAAMGVGAGDCGKTFGEVAQGKGQEIPPAQQGVSVQEQCKKTCGECEGGG